MLSAARRSFQLAASIDFDVDFPPVVATEPLCSFPDRELEHYDRRIMLQTLLDGCGLGLHLPETCGGFPPAQ